MSWIIRHDGTQIDFDRGSVQIRQEADRIDTASFTVTHTTAQSLRRLGEITIDFGTNRIFGGYIQVLPKRKESATVREYRVTARGYAVRLYQTRRVRRAWTDTPVSQIVADILADGGVASEFTSINAGSNPTLAEFYVDADNAGEALDHLRTVLTGRDGAVWRWRVLPDKTVSVDRFDAVTNPWAIAPSGADAQAAGWSGPVKRPLPDAMAVEEDDAPIVNSVRILGGEKASDEMTDTFTGDGARVKFHVAHYPIADLVRVTVNGVEQKVGVDYFDADCPAFQCYVNFSAGYVRFCAPPPAGSVVAVVYRYFVPLVYTAEDAGSISHYGMRFYKDIEDKSVVTEEAAADLANAVLERFAYGALKGRASVELSPTDSLPVLGGRIFVVWPDEGVQGYFNLYGCTWRDAERFALLDVSFGNAGLKVSDVVGARRANGGAYARQRAPRVYGQMGSTALIEELRVGDAYAFLQGVGKWVGRDTDGVYKEFTGDPNGDHWYWDGNELYVSGKFVGDADISGTSANTFTVNNDRDGTQAGLTFGHPTRDAVFTWDGQHLELEEDLTVWRLRLMPHANSYGSLEYGGLYARDGSGSYLSFAFGDNATDSQAVFKTEVVKVAPSHYEGKLFLTPEAGAYIRHGALNFGVRDSLDDNLRRFYVQFNETPLFRVNEDAAKTFIDFRLASNKALVAEVGGTVRLVADDSLDAWRVDGALYSHGHHHPYTDKAWDLGSSSRRWRNVYGNYLNLSGAADIAQDLIVGGGTGVLHVDVSQGNVGINCAPDPQFDLDVAGNLRAQGWIVGEHAIQVDDAIAIMHFDGPPPPETNHHGELVTHMGQSPALAQNLYFVRGRFGKAVVRSVGTWNEFKNPVLGVNADGWHEWWGNQHANGRVAHPRFTGGYAYEIEADADGAPGNAIFAFGNYRIPCAQGEVFAVQFEALHSGGVGQDSPQIYEYDASGNGIGYHYPDTWWVENLGEGMERVYAVFTIQNANAASFLIMTNGPTLNAGERVWYGAAQVEKAGWPTPFFYGDMPGCSWQTTAHASRSRRYEGNLQYDAIVPRDKFTVFGWFKPPVGENTSFSASDRPYGQTSVPGFIQIGNYYGNPSLTVMRWYSSTGTTLYYKDVNDSGWTSTKSISADYGANEWIFIAVTWDGEKFGFYVGRSANGAWHARTQTNIGDGIGIGDPLSLKVLRGIGGLADDVAVVHRAMSESELRAVFESNAPVFAETSTWQFRATPAGLVWADDEGLWVRSESGQAVLGVYGANGTKSWGGHTLEHGDLLIGDGSHYVLWDASAAELEVSGQITILGGSGYDNLSDRPIDGASGLIIRASAASSAGLYAGADKIGYWDGTRWRAYMTSSGDFYLSGSTGDNYLSWNAATDTLTAAGWRFDTDRIIGGNAVLHKDGWAEFGVAPDYLRLDANHADWRIWAGDTDPVYAKFKVHKSGALYATGVDISGKITADSGDIAGWIIDTSELRSPDGKVKLQSGASRIYVGNAYLFPTGSLEMGVAGDLRTFGSVYISSGGGATVEIGPPTNFWSNIDLHGYDIIGVDDISVNDLISGGRLEIANDANVNGALSAGSLSVSGAATLNSGLEVFNGYVKSQWPFMHGNSVGASGWFVSDDGKTVNVSGGIIISIQ